MEPIRAASAAGYAVNVLERLRSPARPRSMVLSDAQGRGERTPSRLLWVDQQLRGGFGKECRWMNMGGFSFAVAGRG
jgi:hypothetical protein